MKKFIGLLIVVIITGIFLGCDLLGIQYYSYEFFRVSITDWGTVVPPEEPLNFNKMKDYRNQLYAKSVEDIESRNDITDNDLIDLFTSRGYSSSQADAIIDTINKNGNELVTFQYDDDPDNYYVLLYIEKL